MRACASFRVRPDETPPLGSYGRGEEEEESKRKVKGFHPLTVCCMNAQTH